MKSLAKKAGVRPIEITRGAVAAGLTKDTPDADVTLEQYTAEQRLTLLEEALDLPVALHFSGAGRALDAASAGA